MWVINLNSASVRSGKTDLLLLSNLMQQRKKEGLNITS